MIDCGREADVLQAAAFDRLDGLRDHLAVCPACADLAAVARALRADREIASHEARLPSAGLVWWRATIRARLDARRVAERPIGLVQTIATSTALGVAGALGVAAWRLLPATGVQDVVSAVGTNGADAAARFSTLLPHALPLVFAVGACLLLAPVALYLVLSRD
jgi:hypothetical protein